MSTQRKWALPALFSMKCPVCLEGFVFVNKGIFPLQNLVKLKPNCDVCHQKLISESNNGGGINYALTVIVLFLNLIWYYPIFGITYKDDSIYYFLTTSAIIAIILQPWLMRISRVIYLYLYLKTGGKDQ
ncbi:MAG: hypothetical protein EBX41_05790 [Chitinophagia bacterium]|nr:hypothetical protein [Chitinophagia bacterium]